MPGGSCMRCGEFPAIEDGTMCDECTAVVVRQQLAERAYEPLFSNDIKWSADELREAGVDIEVVGEHELWMPAWAAVVLRAKRVGRGMLKQALALGNADEAFRNRLHTVVRMGGNAAEYIVEEVLARGTKLRVGGYETEERR